MSNLDTLSGAMNDLTLKGFTEDFKAEQSSIKAIYSKREYKPEDLKIVKVYRFEGATNPSDQSILFAIESNDGLKGTLVMSNSYESSQNTELIKQIPQK
ncbi:MAG: phosphoribosylpyrophosphate synthetase [Bacteroidia bacterium]